MPDEVGGYGSKGVGEIGLVPTAGAVAGALYAHDGIRRTTPADDRRPRRRGLGAEIAAGVAYTSNSIPWASGSSSPQLMVLVWRRM